MQVLLSTHCMPLAAAHPCARQEHPQDRGLCCLVLDVAPGGRRTLTQLGSAGCREGLRPKQQQ